jgi:predicted O-methyltransferase YrrM
MQGLDFDNVLSRFKNNIKENSEKVTIHQGYSSHVLKTLGNEPQYDFAYIDASHTAYGTLEDAILVHPLVKQGGIIIFDDFGWKDPNRPSVTDSPELGISCFVNVFADFYDVVFVGYQIGLIKK